MPSRTWSPESFLDFVMNDQKIILGSSANLTGNSKAAILIIEEGAKFDGMSSMLKAQSIDSKVKKRYQIDGET